MGLVEQLADWLDKAATVDLIDPKHGWEPVRRDHVDDVVISDAVWLRSLAKSEAGCVAFKVRYWAIVDFGAANYWVTLREAKPIPIGPDLADDFTFRNVGSSRVGSGIGLVAWSGKKPDGMTFVADRYMPETVASVEELLARATILGCREYIEPKLTLLQERFRKSQMKVPVPLAVVMLAKRPYPVIGTRSVYELCPYIVELQGGDNLSISSTKTVRPALHREDISEQLMRRASGEEVIAPPPSWSLIGCGSVGSKIALHMARAGRGPDSIVDRGNMLPHNFARHGTYPTDFMKEYGFIDSKTTMLSAPLTELGRRPKQHTLDIVSYVLANRSLKTITGEACFAIVNTTGSATVRETLGSVALTGARPRVVEACLLGAGSTGLMTVEGPSENPSTTDLICEAYLAIQQSPEIAGKVFGMDASEVVVGQGCSTMTMPLRDSRLSLFSAGFAEKLFGLQRDGLPSEGGVLLLGDLHSDGLSQSWIEKKIAPRTLVNFSTGVEVRISPDVDSTIAREVSLKPNSETGGIIFGRYCDVTGHFHVVGTLPAPLDSKFSKDEFVLGVKGLKPMIRKLIESTGGALYPLGTWHNHLLPSGPSAKDMRTAVLLSGLQYFPLLMLIRTPAGYSGVTVETVSGLGR